MQLRSGPLLNDDRELADVLREVNELRRSRSLPEWHPTTTVRVHTRRPSAWSPGLRWCRRLKR